VQHDCGFVLGFVKDLLSINRYDSDGAWHGAWCWPRSCQIQDISLTVAGWAKNDFSWRGLDFLGEKGGRLVWY